MLLRSLNASQVVHLAEARLLCRHLPRVSCDYRDGIIHLWGMCQSFYEKQMAQETVRHLDGVESVVNEIEVDSKAK